MRRVPVDLGAAPPRAAYALDVLFGLLGIERERATASAVLAYGDARAPCRIVSGPQDGWDQPRPLVARVGTLPIVHLPGGPTALSLSDGAIGFDMLYAAYACLTAPWERIDPKDEVGCPIAAQGWLARNQLLREPIVHRYAEILGRALGITPRRGSAIALTHDVDNNFGHLFARRESAELLRRDLRAHSLAAVRRAAGLTRRVGRRAASDPNDRFGDWLRWHKDWQSRPTFFVASAGLFHPGSDRRDVPYDLRHPRVRSTLRSLADEGAEIGVHFSIGAASSAERLRRERESLEEAIGVPVRCARHHWWALGNNPETTYALHAQAGVLVDCSLGFNDRPGFRRGIAAPFPPFDPASEGPSEVWALPTIAMDAAVARVGAAEHALQELRGLDEIVSSVGGILVLDWHVHAANPEALPGAGDALRSFIDAKVAEGTRMLTPLAAISEHGP
jgi:hypothetical protein